jgi:hypothetical protein
MAQRLFVFSAVMVGIAVVISIAVSISVAFMFAILVEDGQWPGGMASQVLLPESWLSQHGTAIFARHVFGEDHVATAPVFHHADRDVPVLLGG